MFVKFEAKDGIVVVDLEMLVNAWSLGSRVNIVMKNDSWSIYAECETAEQAKEVIDYIYKKLGGK